MVDEVELLKKEYEECRFDPAELNSFEMVDYGTEVRDKYYIVRSNESGKHFEIFEPDGGVEEFYEVIRSEETKVVVSWLPV